MQLPSGEFGTILADPPWRFGNRTGKSAPEHKRLKRYETMTTDDIGEMFHEIRNYRASHLYLWVPNALLSDGLYVMKRWGFEQKTQIVWFKRRKDGGPDRRCMGFYFRNCTESCLFGVRGGRRTNPPWNVPNVIESCKRDHSRKPDELYPIIERCSPGPYLELFARQTRDGWTSWGDEAKRGRDARMAGRVDC